MEIRESVGREPHDHAAMPRIPGRSPAHIRKPAWRDQSFRGSRWDQTPHPIGRRDRAWSGWWQALAAATLFTIVFATYGPITRAGYIWDDDEYVTNNGTLRSVDGLRRIWFEIGAVPQYYPLVHSSFWVEYHLWGLAPLGYHLVNVLLHAVGALLFWRLLLRLEVPGAWLAAALFAVHPVAVESVAWVTERKNVLSLALALAAMLSFLRFAPAAPCDAEEQPGRNSGRWGWYVCSLVLFAAALASKTVVASLPAVLLVIYWWKNGKITWRQVAALAAFFVVGAAMGILTACMEVWRVGATGKEWAFTPIDRVLIAGHCAVVLRGENCLAPPPGLLLRALADQFAGVVAICVSSRGLRHNRGAVAVALGSAVVLWRRC